MPTDHTPTVTVTLPRALVDDVIGADLVTPPRGNERAHLDAGSNRVRARCALADAVLASLASPAPAATTVDAFGAILSEPCYCAETSTRNCPRHANANERVAPAAAPLRRRGTFAGHCVFCGGTDERWEPTSCKTCGGVVREPAYATPAPAADASDEEMVEAVAVAEFKTRDSGATPDQTVAADRLTGALLTRLATLRERAERESANAAEADALCEDWKARTEGAERRAAAYCSALARVQAIGCMACRGRPVTSPDGSTHPCAVCNAQPTPKTLACSKCGTERTWDVVACDYWPCPECSKKWGPGRAISPR